jgi:hypothetical protein
MFRSRGQTYAISGLDAEDLAFVFMEEELGRFDWKGNWKKVRENGTARQRVQDWLTAMDLRDQNPDEIITILDQVSSERSGRWL